MKKTYSVQIDNSFCQFDLDSNNLSYGKEELLIHKQNNFLKSVEWFDQGYTVERLLTPEPFNKLQQAIHKNLTKILDHLEIDHAPDWQLSDYHKIVNTNELHQAIISKSRETEISDIDFDFTIISKKITELCKINLTLHNPKLEKDFVIIRIVRPQSKDYNPPHKDGYLDIWKDTLNLFIPISGCDKNSSLPVLPESHLWPENEIYKTQNEAKMNDLTYHVPSIVKVKRKFKMTRPNPKDGEVLMFSPFIIHGCANNLNHNRTRISLEVRLCLQDDKANRY